MGVCHYMHTVMSHRILGMYYMGTPMTHAIVQRQDELLAMNDIIKLSANNNAEKLKNLVVQKVATH